MARRVKTGSRLAISNFEAFPLPDEEHSFVSK